MKRTHGLLNWLLLCLLLSAVGISRAEDLPRIVRESKGAVIAVGTFQPLRSPAFRFSATGFVIEDGKTVVTNAHAIPAALDTTQKESLAIARSRGSGGSEIEVWLAEQVKIDRSDDLALLRFAPQTPLPTLKLYSGPRLEEGSAVAMIGYPIGVVLGLIPAVHRGTIAAHSPMAVPKSTSGQVDARTVRQMRGELSAIIYQLDAVAYPGNSGSPLLSVETGEVVGIINAGLVKGTREAITNPSGISYAVPVDMIHRLLAAPR